MYRTILPDTFLVLAQGLALHLSGVSGVRKGRLRMFQSLRHCFTTGGMCPHREEVVPDCVTEGFCGGKRGPRTGITKIHVSTRPSPPAILFCTFVLSVSAHSSSPSSSPTDPLLLPQPLFLIPFSLILLFLVPPSYNSLSANTHDINTTWVLVGAGLAAVLVLRRRR